MNLYQKNTRYPGKICRSLHLPIRQWSFQILNLWIQPHDFFSNHEDNPISPNVIGCNLCLHNIPPKQFEPSISKWCLMELSISRACYYISLLSVPFRWCPRPANSSPTRCQRLLRNWVAQLSDFSGGRKIRQENCDFCSVNNNDSTGRHICTRNRAAASGHLSRINSPRLAVSARSRRKFAERTCTRSVILRATSYSPSEIE